MSATPRDIYRHIVAALTSSRGHNIMVFLAFLILAALLWWVMALNDEDQCDIRMPLRITNIPDTVTIITPVPPSVAVSLRTKGSQLLKLNLGRVPAVHIDFRAFRSGTTLRLTDADLKAAARAALDGSVVTVITPDTLNLRFTTGPGIPVTVRPDCDVTAGPQATLAGAPLITPDTVRLYSVDGRRHITQVTTEPVRLTSLNRTTLRRVRLIAPPGTRLIPDSVDLTFRVEPLILKTRRLNIEPLGVPLGHRLITFPAQVQVSYMVPVSVYKKNDTPHIRAVADYRSIDPLRPTRMMRVRLVDVSPDLRNVQLLNDSVEYIIEKL